MGQIKRFERQEFTPWRTYRTKAIKFAKLKNEEDAVIAISPIQLDDVLLLTRKGYALRFNIEEVPVVGAKAAGVKAINLKSDDHLLTAFIANASSFYLLTHRGSLKRVATADIPLTSRANRGVQVLRELKAKPHRVFAAGNVWAEEETAIDFFTTASKEPVNQVLQVISTTGQVTEVPLVSLNLSERTSNGSFVSDKISEEGVQSAHLRE